MLSFILDPWYFIVVGPFMLLAWWASSRVKGTFQKFNQIPIRSGFTGAQTAQAMLKGAGIHDVSIESVPGMLSDHYDPRDKVVRLSDEILHGRRNYIRSMLTAMGSSESTLNCSRMACWRYVKMRSRSRLTIRRCITAPPIGE